MFETVFGAEMPLAVRFFIAFLVVLGLIGLTAWVVRRFGADRFGNATTRGRAPRLAVIDAASVDSRRRLVIIRRDNVEHLLMIGGPTDVVVETNIVRAAAATPRDVAVARTGADTLPRAVPLPEPPWQTAPEPSLPEPPPRAQPVPLVRPSPRAADTIAGLASELSVRPPAPTDLDKDVPPRPGRPTATPPLAPDAPAAASEDQNLAEMAQLLEQSLRRPVTQGNGASAPVRAAETRVRPDTVSAPKPPASAGPTPAAAEPASASSDAKQTQAKQIYDSLEQEMATLLGRPKSQT